LVLTNIILPELFDLLRIGQCLLVLEKRKLENPKIFNERKKERKKEKRKKIDLALRELSDCICR
jgi:hypothetical protein